MPARVPWHNQNRFYGTGSLLPQRVNAARPGQPDPIRAAVNLSLGLGQPGRVQRRAHQLAGWRPRSLPTLAEVFPTEFPEAATPSRTSTAGPPGDSAPPLSQWHSRYRELESERAQRAQEQQQAANMAKALREREAAARRSAAELVLSKALGEEEVMSPVQSAAKAMVLWPAVFEAREALKANGGAAPGKTRGLTRLVKLADSWLEHWDSQEADHRSKIEHEQRVRRGEAGNWEMSQEQFEERVLAGDLGAVRAGIRARLSVLKRLTHTRRQTLVHVACEQLARPNVAESHRLTSSYIKIVNALLNAGANSNAIDDDGFTPFDLALQGASLHVQDALRRFGLQPRNGPRCQEESSFTLQAHDVTPREQATAVSTAALAQAAEDGTTRSPSKQPEEDLFRAEELDDGFEDMTAFEDSQPGPLAQFLATGALLCSQGGWWKSSDASLKNSWQGTLQASPKDVTLKNSWQGTWQASPKDLQNSWSLDRGAWLRDPDAVVMPSDADLQNSWSLNHGAWLKDPDTMKSPADFQNSWSLDRGAWLRDPDAMKTSNAEFNNSWSLDRGAWPKDPGPFQSEEEGMEQESSMAHPDPGEATDSGQERLQQTPQTPAEANDSSWRG